MKNTEIKELPKEGLWDSKPINFHLRSQYEQVSTIVDLMLDEVIECIKENSNSKRVHTDKIRASLVIVLLNLFSAYLSNKKKYIAYPRSPGGYKKSRYMNNNIGYDILVKKVVDVLEILGYISNHMGFYDNRFNFGKNSRMQATSRLTGLFDEYKLAPVMIQREECEEVIILKSVGLLNDKKHKFRVDYEDTEQTNQMRENLHSINSLLDSRWIDLNVSDETYEEIAKETEKKKNRSDIDFTRKKLVRSFNNNSFVDGGRFYHGWWQEIPKQYRKYITIDGKRTVEVDYSSIHFRILYAREGVDIGDDDPYVIEGYEDRRSVVKIALNIILNAESKDKAINAIYKNDRLNTNKETAKDIYKRLEERHPKIKKYFGSGEGVKLQYIDSQVAEQVMLNLVKDNIVVLPVHDSFIVRMSHQIDLHEEMDKAFKDIVGVESKRDKKATVVGGSVQLQESERLYGDKGERFYNEDGSLESIIVSSGDIDPIQLLKLDKEYNGYHLREEEWVEHKGRFNGY